MNKKTSADGFIWWKHGVIYHIYPRSFFDTTNNGIGDIPGVTKKLNYLKSLGVDAIWLSPVYQSPQIDFGYDVSDYKKIDPLFGNMADFKELVNKAHKKGIRIIMDMVFNHTSEQHPWFIESKASLKSCKRDWYIWKKGKGKIKPNNWKSAFGSSGWEYDKNTDEYYYHSFLKEQPDLNWRNSEVKQAMFAELKFWLELGVDGFRLDVINFIAKDKLFRNNPNFVSLLFRKKRPYTRDRNKSLKIIKDLRLLLNEYPDKACIGEIFTPPPGNPRLAAKYLGNGKNALHMAFDFSLIFTSWNARKYAKTIQKSYGYIPKKGWPSLVLSNHDLSRSYSKPIFRKNRLNKAKLKALLLLALKGTPFIYYGEELGMENFSVERKRIQDPLGKKYWPLYKGRDKARTPMQWDASINGGFTKSDPWLPTNRNYRYLNVQNLKKNPNSLLNHYKKLIEIRKKHKSLHKGNWEMIDYKNQNILAFKRSWKKETSLIILNFSGRLQVVYCDLNGEIIYTTASNSIAYKQLNYLTLNPYEGIIIH